MTIVGAHVEVLLIKVVFEMMLNFWRAPGWMQWWRFCIKPHMIQYFSNHLWIFDSNNDFHPAAAFTAKPGLKFILDSNLKGKISIFMQSAAPQEEAFNQLSKALAMQGIGIVKNETAYVVRSAKQLQRDQIEVSSQKPNPNPERMYSLVYSFKHQSASDIVKNIRTFLSKDGEMVVHKESNKIIFTDWTSKLQRVYDLIERLDTPSEWSDKKCAN